MPFGALAIILGGLASTTSALNATVYSSSRVSFAMGRGGDLPNTFGLIHRQRRTPHIAIYGSGVLIILFALVLPVEDVASGASLTFLVLFLLTNFSLIRLRKTHPDIHRSFKVPWVPFLPYLTIAIQGLLAFQLFSLSPLAWAVTILWTIFGIWVYNQLGGREEAALVADTILHEEIIAKKGYSVLLPVSSAPEARQLTRIAAMFAHPRDGEVFALHVIRVPQTLELGAGRAFLKQGRPILEEAIEIGKEEDVPIRTQLRLGRNFAKSIDHAAQERGADLLLLSWEGYTDTPDSSYGSVIDPILRNPPCDVAVIRLVRGAIAPKKILVPVAGGLNAHRALELAKMQSRFVESKTGEPAKIVALNILRGENGDHVEKRRKQLREEFFLDEQGIELRVVQSKYNDLAEDILEAAAGFGEIIIGASEEGLLEQALLGSVPQRVAASAQVNVIMVKRHDPIKHGLIQRLLGWRKGSNATEEEK